MPRVYVATQGVLVSLPSILVLKIVDDSKKSLLSPISYTIYCKMVNNRYRRWDEE